MEEDEDKKEPPLGTGTNGPKPKEPKKEEPKPGSTKLEGGDDDGDAPILNP